jgi:hypothetical protein
MKISKTSVALLVIQLALVSSIAAKYLYQRWVCPRVWTRTVVYDPALLMRGRYLSLQLMVDGCRSTLPSAKQAAVPKNADGLPAGPTFSIRSPQAVQFAAKLEVEGNKLVAIRIPEGDSSSAGLMVEAAPGSSCDEMRLDAPTDFYISEHAANPSPLKPGQELWIEVTVPSQGPPRPIQLALKDGGAWKPLAFQ